MACQDILDKLLVALVLRYEEDPNQFVTLTRQTLDSSLARIAVAELRNEGLVEEQTRGVIRLTARGYKKYKTTIPALSQADSEPLTDMSVLFAQIKVHLAGSC
jgi:hypothetical protein